MPLALEAASSHAGHGHQAVWGCPAHAGGLSSLQSLDSTGQSSVSQGRCEMRVPNLPAAVRKARFTTRSSRLWKLMTASRPPAKLDTAQLSETLSETPRGRGDRACIAAARPWARLPTCSEAVDGGGQRSRQRRQLVVDGDAQRLEGARGRVDAAATAPPAAPAASL